MNIEKINLHKSNSNCSSDTDSEEDENQFLLDFIFNKSKFENKNNLHSVRLDTEISTKDDHRNHRDGLKNGKLNGKQKKVLNGARRDAESQYRKVLVTTDLKSDSRASKIPKFCITFF